MFRFLIRHRCKLDTFVEQTWNWFLVIPQSPIMRQGTPLYSHFLWISLRGCLHKKTRTGASFIPGWLFDFVTLLCDWLGHFTSHYLKVHFMLIKYTCDSKSQTLHMRYTFQSTDRPISHRNGWSFPVYMIPLRDFVKFSDLVKFSPRFENRGELTPGWLAPAWHFVVVSCKQIQSHEREPEWTRFEAKVAPLSCKQPLRRTPC